MKIFIPLMNGELTPHFGHCEEFAVITLEDPKGDIQTSERIKGPAHEPGSLPRFLIDQGASLVIAGGMGGRARDMLVAKGIEVVVGGPSKSPEEVVALWQEGEIGGGENQCNH
jgi:ATP-binding protein involved in chromosome partitioning